MISVRKVTAGSGVEIRSIAAPTLVNATDVIIDVSHAGICGTDLHIERWTQSYHFLQKHLPVTIGHEFSGTVSALGSGVSELAVGDQVTLRPSTLCGVCPSCMQSEFDLCVNRRGLGVVRDGGFAQQVVAPARNCVRIPKNLALRLAALTEPMTVSYESVRTAGVTPGSRVLILGPGNIGQGIALFCREFKAKQIVIAGFDDERRFEVLRSLGFTETIDTQFVSLSDGVKQYVGNNLFDVVIEATGVSSVIEPALNLLKVGGTLVITGIHKDLVAIDLTKLVRNQQQIRGSYRAREADWSYVLDFMDRHQDYLRQMVTHEFALGDALLGFEAAHAKVATKVLLSA
jgi:threonine dehydrogenase-like Zn-dependent dehydrogenase